MKNRRKMVLKNIIFLNVELGAFFFFGFWRFWLDFGMPRDVQKLTKNRKNRVRDALGTRLGFLIDFGSDFGPIFGDFGWIFDGFWMDFGGIFGRFWKLIKRIWGHKQ